MELFIKRIAETRRTIKREITESDPNLDLNCFRRPLTSERPSTCDLDDTGKGEKKQKKKDGHFDANPSQEQH